MSIDELVAYWAAQPPVDLSEWLATMEPLDLSGFGDLVLDFDLPILEPL